MKALQTERDIARRKKPNLIKVNKFLPRILPAVIALAFMSMATMTSCNKKTEEEEDATYTPSTNLAVTDFKLGSNTDIMANLDSVYFAIDLVNAVIFNADSLPTGTDISGLTVTVTYPSSVSEAVIEQSGGSRDGEFSYKDNPTDTIDFNSKVTLKLTAQDGTTTRSYRLKVNVHTTTPDTLAWDRIAFSELPSRMPAPAAQKTTNMGQSVFMLLQESDGTYTMSRTDDLTKSQWQKTPVSMPFTPAIRSMVATDSSIFILSSSGDLYSSADGLTWQPTGMAWSAIIGAYGERLLGLRIKDGHLMHTEYPSGTEAIADAKFPVEGFSNLVHSTNKWTTTSSAMIVGGRMADGQLTNATWGFDGRVWARIDNSSVPYITGATLVPYYIYRSATGSAFNKKEYPVWLTLGGRLKDNSLNQTAYVSYTNGVNWTQADSLMQMPEFIPGLENADNLVYEASLSANLSDAWTRATMTRAQSFVIDGDIIKWDCPYIYLIGGEDATGRLSDTIWRGVLMRLTYTPVF